MLQCVPGLSSGGGGGGDEATTHSAHSTMIVQQWNVVLCKVEIGGISFLNFRLFNLHFISTKFKHHIRTHLNN